MKDKEKQFKERIDCGIAYCEDTAVDEIKQDFKIQEEEHKQIEEMAKEIYNAIVDCKWTSCLKCEFGSIPRDFCKSKYIAKILVEHYQPKIPEDSVVLTKEEFEFMCVDTKKVREQEVKETAEKILRKGHEYLMNSTDKAVAFSCFLGMIEAEFGVEIKE